MAAGNNRGVFGHEGTWSAIMKGKRIERAGGRKYVSLKPKPDLYLACTISFGKQVYTSPHAVIG